MEAESPGRPVELAIFNGGDDQIVARGSVGEARIEVPGYGQSFPIDWAKLERHNAYDKFDDGTNPLGRVPRFGCKAVYYNLYINEMFYRMNLVLLSAAGAGTRRNPSRRQRSVHRCVEQRGHGGATAPFAGRTVVWSLRPLSGKVVADAGREPCLSSFQGSMKILITGGAGYLGSRVTAHLLRVGHRITVFDKLVYGAEALLPLHGDGHFKLTRGDVRNADQVTAALTDIDTIVHFAAVVGEPACAVDSEQSWSINVDGTKTVIAAAQAAKVARLIFVSTCSNYGVAKPGELATEESALNPLSDYARAKVECERFILAAAPPPASTVLRFGTICGLSGRMRFDLFGERNGEEVRPGREDRHFLAGRMAPVSPHRRCGACNRTHY